MKSFSKSSTEVNEDDYENLDHLGKIPQSCANIMLTFNFNFNEDSVNGVFVKINEG